MHLNVPATDPDGLLSGSTTSINVPIGRSTTQTSTILQANVEYQIQVKRSNLIDTTQTEAAPFGYGGDAEYAWPYDTIGSDQGEDTLLGTDVGLQLTAPRKPTSTGANSPPTPTTPTPSTSPATANPSASITACPPAPRRRKGIISTWKSARFFPSSA